MCGHSKADEKDSALIAKIPMLRKTLETLVFRVKAMLDRNGCANAFWIGNLKHKSIKGVELSSQMPIPESTEPTKATANKKKKRKPESNSSTKKHQKEASESQSVSQLSKYSSSSSDDSESESEKLKQKTKKRNNNSDSDVSVYERMFGSDDDNEEEADQISRKRDLSTEIDEGPVIDEGPSIYMEDDSTVL
jgi:hypothetical protein